MRIEVRYFAAVRDAVGQAAETLEVPADARLADLVRALEARHPALTRHRTGLRFALGQRFAGLDERLSEGGEVALIPPVSGG
jgi:molybdopterin synthase sulfur carrier subunit